MQRLYTSEQARAIDYSTTKDCHIPSIILMERAALCVTERVVGAFNSMFQPCSPNAKKKVLAVAGMGNNGGDSVAVARQLMEHNITCDIYVLSKNIKDSLKTQLNMAHSMGIDIFYKCPDLSDYVIVIDGIFGTGLDREISGYYKDIIENINVSNKYVISVDIPSGISSDTGAVLGCAIKANETVTFGRNKLGLTLYPAIDYVGNVSVCDIGFPRFIEERIANDYFLLEKNDIKKLEKRSDDSNKGTFGNILIIAGSENMGGAGILSASSGIHTGAGKVTVCTHVSNRTAMLSTVPEAILKLYNTDDTDICNWIIENVNKYDSVVVGPGLGQGKQAESIVHTVLEYSDISTIIDADAINICARDLDSNRNVFLSKRSKYRTILTPHLKEFSRLTGLSVSDIKSNIVETAKLWARRLNIILVLKDSKTIITDGYRVIINNFGCNGMATAGSGDVLTGIIANTVLNTPKINDIANREEKNKIHFSQLENVSLGVLIHALAGESARDTIGNRSMSATDIVKGISDVLK